MAKSKLTFKEKQIKYRLSCLQKGDLVFIKGRWRQIKFIHKDTICFTSYTKTWGRSKLAWYNLGMIWRNIKFVIKENHDKKDWEYKKRRSISKSSR